LDKVKVYPLLGLKAIRNNAGGAYRYWLFARAIATESRTFKHADLCKRLVELGAHPKTVEGWRKKAEALGLVFSWPDADRFLAAKKTYKLFCCPVDRNPVNLPADVLLSKGWRAWIWAAWLSANVKGQISRETLARLTGVPEGTQRGYERTYEDMGGHLGKRKNYAVWAPRKRKGLTLEDYVQHFREGEHPGAFIMRGKRNHRLAWPLPNSYNVVMDTCKPGQLKYITPTKYTDLYYPVGVNRVFFADRHAIEEKQRRLASVGLELNAVEAYTPRQKYSGFFTCHVL